MLWVVSVCSLYIDQAAAVTKYKGYIFGNSGYRDDAGITSSEASCAWKNSTGNWANTVKLLCGGLPNWDGKSSDTMKASFISHVQGLLSGSSQEKVAGTFIIITMLGYGPGGHSILPNSNSDSTIIEWKKRINNSDITMSVDNAFSYSVNSGYSATGASPTRVLDATYYDGSGTYPSYVFKDTAGTTKYAVKISCGNPVGDLPGLPTSPPKWGTNGSVAVPSIARRGDTVQFTYSITNNGPDATDKTINWSTSQGGSGSYTTIGAGSSVYPAANNVTIPSDAAIGSTVCSTLTWSPASSSGGPGTASKCTKVVGTWTIDGNIIISSATDPPAGSASIGTAYAGTTIYFNYDLKSTGPDTSDSISWNADGTTGALSMGGNTTSRVQTNQAYAIPATTAGGTVICKTLTWKPKSSINPITDSTQRCVTVIGIKPVQAYFFGGDVWAKGNLKAAPDAFPGYKTRAQYGVFSNNGTIATTFKSANADPIINGVTNEKVLDFANDSVPYGNFGGLQVVQPISGFLTAPSPSPGVFDLSTITTPNTVLQFSGDTTLHGTLNTQAYIYVQGKVTIDADILYDTSAKSKLADVPNLVIGSTGGIVINDSVSQVDATLLTDGVLQTCEVKPSTGSMCKNMLTINGPTRASDYRLFRTNNTAISSTQAAETFYYRPAAIVAPYSGMSTAKMVMATDTETELPPRY